MEDKWRLWQGLNFGWSFPHLDWLHVNNWLHVHLVVKQRPLVRRMGLKNIRRLVEERPNDRQLANMLGIQGGMGALLSRHFMYRVVLLVGP